MYLRGVSCLKDMSIQDLMCIMLPQRYKHIAHQVHNVASKTQTYSTSNEGVVCCFENTITQHTKCIMMLQRHKPP